MPGPRYPGGGTARFGLSSIADTGFATGGLNLYRSQGVMLRGERGSADRPTIEYQLGVVEPEVSIVYRYVLAASILILWCK